MTSTSRTPLKIQLVEQNDIPTLIQISHSAFEHDRHTRMKMHEKGTDDINSEMPSNMMDGYFDNPRVRMIKAVDEDGRIIGYTNWAEWNFDGTKSVVGPEVPFDAPVDHPDYPVSPDMPLIQQLGNIASGHLHGMQNRLNRASPAMYCLGISVLPEAQSHGVASALLGWVTSYADEKRASCWIHLSDNFGGVKALEKNGFKVVNTLEMDLDQYAVKEKPDGGKWGIYVFRYMRREATGENGTES